jgi:hypothetical protein
MVMSFRENSYFLENGDLEDSNGKLKTNSAELVPFIKPFFS